MFLLQIRRVFWTQTDHKEKNKKLFFPHFLDFDKCLCKVYKGEKVIKEDEK